MKLISEIDAARAEIQTLRRDIHAHPELCFEERRTSDVVAEKLTEWGIPIHRGLGTTGVVGILKNGTSDRAIGLRADMDALPIHEANTFSHASKHEGKMHACGHDGHTAMLLAAAQYLQKHRPFDGTVYLIFQPAEEGGGGAREMIKDGLFERFPMEAVFGMHNWPGVPVGTFALTPGPIMASSNEFKITLTGKGTHAGIPHAGIDPVIAAASLAQALQSILTRNKRPIDAAVLSITQIHAGDATNVVPDTAWLGGTIRTFSVEVLDLIETRLRELSEYVSKGFGCSAEVSFHRNYPPTINDPAMAELCAGVMRGIVGEKNVNAKVEPTMGAEDFSFMLLEKPGAYVFIGNGEGDHRDSGHGLGPCNLHNASYDFNDELLPLGGTYWVKLVESYFSRT
ncbi:amidohydrolase [Pandoraea terrae]|uniref:Amidohydrolase n=1 Tax=Pandoraea terrae TaxID=1537710 RepID=A0A5E4YQ91_9BURK|nr:M20 aminoacylase family protein [Pandoraea terrae]VVE50508.1 amidohydrolase [Pandoraea terrae]